MKKRLQLSIDVELGSSYSSDDYLEGRRFVLNRIDNVLCDIIQGREIITGGNTKRKDGITIVLESIDALK